MSEDEEVTTRLDEGERQAVAELAAVALSDGQLAGADRGKLRALALKAGPSDRNRINDLLGRTKPEAKPVHRPARDPAEAHAAHERGVARAQKAGGAPDPITGRSS